ncbi:MAG: phosphomannomutase/phosphoglucomutase, partial [Gammaproteobacteria bacterium]
EMSGHLFFKEWYDFDDALYAAARMLAILSLDPRPPAEVFRSLPNAVSTPELRVEMKEGAHYAFMKRLLKEAPAWVQRQFPEARVTTIDGLRIDLPEGFGLVRASNTTPSLILRFEGQDEEALKRIQGAFRDLLKSLDPSLILPF